MSKFIRVFSIVLIIFSLVINFYSVYASSIDMNLATNADNSIENNIANNSEDSLQDTNNMTSATTTNDEVSPSSVGSISEEGLGLSNILSILLITIGVVLILLAIAIIIRLK